MYHDLETLNNEAIAWLHRTANKLPHGKTKLSPVEQWKIEKDYLTPYTPVALELDQAKLYTVRKDNVLVYKSNFYSLPEGTWQRKGTQVNVTEKEGFISVKDLEGSLILHTRRSSGKGQTILNNDHKRDKSAKIDQLILEISALFEAPRNAKVYFEDLKKQKPRYIRDQLQIIRNCFQVFNATIMNMTLNFCSMNHIYSASDFKAVAKKLDRDQKHKNQEKPSSKPTALGASMTYDLKPNTSELVDYETLMSNRN